MLRSKQLYIFLFFIAIALTIIVNVVSNNTKVQPAISSNKPDSFAQNVKAIRYDRFGKLSSQLFAPKMLHYPNNNLTVFFRPVFTLYNTNKTPWIISADSANAKNGLDHIELIGHVKLHQTAGKNNPDTILSTTIVNIDGKNRIATTDKPVTMLQKNTDGSQVTINSIGMYANQNSGDVKLLSHVRGYYVPAPSVSPSNSKNG